MLSKVLRLENMDKVAKERAEEDAFVERVEKQTEGVRGAHKEER